MAQGWGMWKGGGVVTHQHGSGVGYVEGGGGCDPPAWLRGGVCGRGGGGGCDPPAWLRGGVCGRGGCDPPAWLRGGVCGGGGIVIHLHGSGVGYAEGEGS